MRINQSEIADDIEAHVRKFGGDFSEWCVGTAKDRQGAFCQRYAAEDFGLICREAYTNYAAEGVVEQLVHGCGLHADRDSARGSFVFVYRVARTKSPKEAAVSAHV